MMYISYIKGRPSNMLAELSIDLLLIQPMNSFAVLILSLHLDRPHAVRSERFWFTIFILFVLGPYAFLSIFISIYSGFVPLILLSAVFVRFVYLGVKARAAHESATLP